MSACALGVLSPSHSGGDSRFSKQMTAPGSNVGAAADAGVLSEAPATAISAVINKLMKPKVWALENMAYPLGND
jgi:hypothetical protein